VEKADFDRRYAFRIVSLFFIRRIVSRLFTVVERVESTERRCGRQSPRQVEPASRLCAQYPRTTHRRWLVTVACSTHGRRPREHRQVSFARRQQRLVAVRTVVTERRCSYIYNTRNLYISRKYKTIGLDDDGDDIHAETQ